MFLMYRTEHRAFDNVAFQAVYRRECIHVVEWLRTKEAWKYPEPDDLDAMRHGLERWEDMSS
jgi:tRNA A37 threonylcarbamoyladenosine biosynthesis protein TsaE